MTQNRRILGLFGRDDREEKRKEKEERGKRDRKETVYFDEHWCFKERDKKVRKGNEKKEKKKKLSKVNAQKLQNSKDKPVCKHFNKNFYFIKSKQFKFMTTYNVDEIIKLH